MRPFSIQRFRCIATVMFVALGRGEVDEAVVRVWGGGGWHTERAEDCLCNALDAATVMVVVAGGGGRNRRPSWVGVVLVCINCICATKKINQYINMLRS